MLPEAERLQHHTRHAARKRQDLQFCTSGSPRPSLSKDSEYSICWSTNPWVGSHCVIGFSGQRIGRARCCSLIPPVRQTLVSCLTQPVRDNPGRG